MEVKKVAEEWEIWEEEVAKSGKETKKLVPQRFYKQIYVFRKKASKRILIKKVWNYAIEVKKDLCQGKVYLLSREERGKVDKFIKKQLRKGYIRPSKLSQIALVFFVGKKNSKKHIV